MQQSVSNNNSYRVSAASESNDDEDLTEVLLSLLPSNSDQFEVVKQQLQVANVKELNNFELVHLVDQLSISSNMFAYLCQQDDKVHEGIRLQKSLWLSLVLDCIIMGFYSGLTSVYCKQLGEISSTKFTDGATALTIVLIILALLSMAFNMRIMNRTVGLFP